MKKKIVLGVCGYPYQGQGVPEWFAEVVHHSLVWVASGNSDEDLTFARSQIPETGILVVRPGWPISDLDIPSPVMVIQCDDPAKELRGFIKF